MNHSTFQYNISGIYSPKQAALNFILLMVLWKLLTCSDVADKVSGQTATSGSHEIVKTYIKGREDAEGSIWSGKFTESV